MNGPYALLALLLLQGCSSAPVSSEVAVMDEIERQVRLPDGSRALTAYARYYAPGEGGTVLGEYVIPRSSLGPDQGCAEMTGDGGLKDVPCSPEPESLTAGQRRWLSNADQLPGVSDGGCNIINVSYDLQTQRLESVSCNGRA